ncbi:tail fiber domain-containing protein [Burkholderia glumae]|uniref:tail fiber domain-containing protein n=1 Tax=Burkholderia glumae TaxID=337 RepID=UPI002036D5FD|nr:tail fiber domain-containing protein [Burkholderia glumae]MCM2537719.1 tail fiber domain-containing protein [Burkholderia glumae]
MTTLQTISLGNAPDGSGGDTVRSANAKVNANTAILDACVALGYQIVSANKTLAATDAGSRFGLVFQAAGGIVVLPRANSVRQNGIVHFFNIGTQAVNIGFQGSDGALITKINAGDWVQYASDGNAYWHVVARGRLTLDEVIGGALSTVGAITSGGLLTAPNILATTIDASGSGGQFRAIQGGYGAILRNDGFAVYLMSTDKNNATGSFNALRPFWWNLVNGQVTIAGDGAKTTIGGALTVNGQILAPEGTVQAPGISFQNDGSPDTGLFHIGDGVFGISCNTTEVVRYSPSGAQFSATPTVSGNAMWHAGNLNPSNYLPKAGGALTGALTSSALVYSSNGILAGGGGAIAGLYNGTNSADGAALQGSGGVVAQCKTASVLWLSKNGNVTGQWDSNFVQFYVTGSSIGSINSPNGTSISYNTSSDYRLKANYAPLDGATETLLRIKFYEGEFKAAPGERAHYVLAHELQEVVPQAVSGEKDAVSDDGAIVPQQVDYSKLVPLLGAALQEAMQRIAALEAKVAS